MTDPGSGIRQTEHLVFVRRTWPAYPRHLAALHAEVRLWLAPLVLPRDAENDLLLAVDEAAGNCIEHAYTPATVDGTIEVTFWTETRSIWIEIVDHGRWRTPSGRSTSRDRGLAAMRRLVPVVLIHQDNRGTRVLLSCPLPRPVPEIATEPAGDGTAAGRAVGVRPCRSKSLR